MVDLGAKLAGVPAALVRCVRGKDIEVFAASKDNGNPYRKGDRLARAAGSCCEAAMKSRDPFLVTDSRIGNKWRGHPDAERGMHSYLGVSIAWPDGEIFGTLCLLDGKANSHTPAIISLMGFFRSSIEEDLLILMESERIAALVMSESRLLSALDRTNTLLREVHHRVKNNYATLISLLNLQMPKSSKAGRSWISRFIRDFQSRITAMSLVHQNTCFSNSMDTVDLKRYTGELAKSVLRTYERHDIHVTLEGDDVILRNNDAGTIGMILNELMTNSIKYAFPEGRRGNISIVIRKKKGGSFSMEYEDDGEPFRETITGHETDSLGLMLITMLPRQMNGNVSFDPSAGKKFVFALNGAQ
jgi:two-component sensor histidine kinase